MEDDLLELYRSETASRLSEARVLLDAAGRGDGAAVEKLSSLAHKMRGTGSSYGYPAVSIAAGVLMEVARDARAGHALDVQRAREQLDSIERAIAAGPTVRPEW